MSAAALRLWRRFLLIRERDPVTGLYRCQLSGLLLPSWAVQAHHCKPKSLRPDLAYRLDNGAIVSTAGHQGPIHNFNASRDVRQERGWWLEFVPMFYRQNRLASRRKFNQAAQARIQEYLTRKKIPTKKKIR